MSSSVLSSRFQAFSLLALPLAVAALSACSKEAPPAAPPSGPLPVKVMTVALGPVPETIEVVAQAEGAREVEVRARVQGILEKRVFEEGQKVKAGALLFEIERAPYEIAQAQAKAQWAQAQAQAAAALAQGAQAGSNLTQAKREFARLQALLKDRAVSQREVDAAENAVQSAQAAVQSAAAAVAGADAAKSAAEAQIASAELNLSYTRVTAPVAGITGRAVKSEGALVTPADGLLTTLVQADPIWVRFSLSEADLARIPGGKAPAEAVERVRLLLPDGSEYAADGKLNFSGARFDPKLGTLALRAEFPNPKDALLPGQFLRAKVAVGARQGVCILPQEAVLRDAGGRFVLLAGADNAVERRVVEAGAWQGENWLILGGLKEGERVILTQHAKLGMMLGMMAPGTLKVAPMAEGANEGKAAGKDAGAPEVKGGAK